MKKILVTLIILSGAGTANAQEAKFGIKGGGLLTTANRDYIGLSNLENKIAPGYYAAGFIEVSFKSMPERFKIQVEANYTNITIEHNYRTAGIAVNEKARGHFLSVPVLVKYFFTPSLALYAGPAGSFNLGSKAVVKVDNATPISKQTNNEVNKFQFGGMAGANYYIGKAFFVEARYHSQFPNYYKSGSFMPSYGTIHNFQLGVGYKFL